MVLRHGKRAIDRPGEYKEAVSAEGGGPEVVGLGDGGRHDPHNADGGPAHFRMTGLEAGQELAGSPVAGWTEQSGENVTHVPRDLADVLADRASVPASATDDAGSCREKRPSL